MKVKTKALLHLLDCMMAMQKEIEGLRNDLNELRARFDDEKKRRDIALKNQVTTYQVNGQVNGMK